MLHKLCNLYFKKSGLYFESRLYYQLLAKTETRVDFCRTPFDVKLRSNINVLINVFHMPKALIRFGDFFCLFLLLFFNIYPLHKITGIIFLNEHIFLNITQKSLQLLSVIHLAFCNAGFVCFFFFVILLHNAL